MYFYTAIPLYNVQVIIDIVSGIVRIGNSMRILRASDLLRTDAFNAKLFTKTATLELIFDVQYGQRIY